MRANSTTAARPGILGLTLPSITREELFAALCILSLANTFAADMAEYFLKQGLFESLINTFGVSAIMWLAAYFGVSLVLRDNGGELSALDLTAAAVALLLILIPSTAASALALTIVSLRLVNSSQEMSPQRRGGLILLAATVPLLWSPLLFQFLSKYILQIDASLVAWALGTARNGNLVRFVDDSGYLVIYSACSSLKNVSLTFLCWVIVTQVVRHRWSPADPLWCLLACASVIAVNVFRISLMGLSGWHYDTFHGEVAGAFFNTIELALALGFSVLGTRREIFSRV